LSFVFFTCAIVLVFVFVTNGFRFLRWIIKAIRGSEPSLAGNDQGELGFNQPKLSRFTRFMDSAYAVVWPFKPAGKMRLAFPCPACCQPLLGKVAPGEELVCPWCRTAFQTPEPPPAAPPVPKKLLKKAREKESPKGSLPWRIFKGASITCGICVFVSLLIVGLIDSVFGLVLMPVVAVGGWVLQAVHRRFWRKEPFLCRSILGEGGGAIVVGEVIRSVAMAGSPFAIILILWVVFLLLYVVFQMLGALIF
jgi:hypothetical protein